MADEDTLHLERYSIDARQLVGGAQKIADERQHGEVTLLHLLGRAEREATRDKSPDVGVEHLLHALAQEIKGPAGEILSGFGIGPGAFPPHIGALPEASREPSGTTRGRP